MMLHQLQKHNYDKAWFLYYKKSRWLPKVICLTCYRVLTEEVLRVELLYNIVVIMKDEWYC
jgi:hypothetical protein